jgi:hypothetical protein
MNKTLLMAALLLALGAGGGYWAASHLPGDGASAEKTPLYWVNPMDPAHRKAAYDAIDKLIESEEYSQIFLVSHYQEGYGALTDSEILVLCDSNVRMPQGLPFNKHVTMTLQ